MEQLYHKLMNLLAWILFGLIVGIIAHAIDPKSSHGGLINAVLLGMGGAFLGGLLATTLFGLNLEGFNLSSFLIAVSGALLLLVAGRFIRKEVS
jgi:uncharacterized membrane protein YeaQ/YmgE (transglycosylase-associated protein family)